MAELNTVIVTDEDKEMQPEKDDEMKTDLQARWKQIQDKMNELELKVRDLNGIKANLHVQTERLNDCERQLKEEGLKQIERDDEMRTMKSESEARWKQMQDKINEMEWKVNNMDQLTKDLDRVKAKLHVQTERLDNCEMQLKAIDKKVDGNEERITAAGNKVMTINNKPTTLDICLFNSIGRKIPSEYIGITKTIQKLQNLGKFGTLREKDGRLMSEFTWKVEDIEEEIGIAEDDDDYCIESDPFYTNVPGYKVKLCLYPNDRLSKHLGVYLDLVEGEFDDIVSWPFNCKFELYSVGRDGTRFASASIDPSSITDGDDCFDQPPINNGGYGEDKYMKSDTLLANKDRYLIDGDLKIKATIWLINESGFIVDR